MVGPGKAGDGVWLVEKDLMTVAGGVIGWCCFQLNVWCEGRSGEVLLYGVGGLLRWRFYLPGWFEVVGKK